MGVEEFGMKREVSPENPDEGEESPASTSASPENALEGIQTPDGSLYATGVSAAVLDATSSVTTSRCSSPLPNASQAGHFQSNSFQRWKRQMQRAWKWGSAGGGVSGGNREQSLMATLNLEIMAKQKRLWYRSQSKNRVTLSIFILFCFLVPEWMPWELTTLLECALCTFVDKMRFAE